MGNLTFYVTIAFVSGIIASCNKILEIKVLLATSPILIIWGYFIFKKKECWIEILVVIVFFFFGVFSFNYHNFNPLESFYGEKLYISGEIVKIDSIKDDSMYVTATINSKIDLNRGIYNGKFIAYIDKKHMIEEGMQIEGFGNLVEPKMASNYNEFDYKNYLNNKGIKGILFFDDEFQIEKGENKLYEIKGVFKNYVIKVFDDNMDKGEAGLLKGIILGDTDYIEESTLNHIRGLGIAHVVAVSGLHVGIILSFFAFIMRLFSIRRSLSIFFGLILTWIYGALIGFPISVFRALIMFSIMYLGMLTHRRYDFFHSLFVAVIVMLIINPLWVFDISFQLSFIAITAVGIFLNISKKYQFSKIMKGIFFIIFIQCMILPVSIYYFNYIPVLSLMSNLLFIPVISISLFLSAVAIIINLFFPYFAEIIFIIINYILKASIYFFEKLSQIPINGINIYTPSFKEITVYYIVLIIFVNGLLFKDEILRFFEIYFVCVLSLFLYIVIFMILPVSFDENMYISIIDVGQGASSFIKYKDTKFMIDAGGEVSRNYDRAGEVLPTYLLKRGIYSLDTVFLTHYHEDHYSGINEINDILGIDSIVSGYYNDEILSEFNGIKFYKMNKGNILSLGSDFTIEILWPEKDFFSSDENRNSLVMLLNFEGFNALFTGDIDEFVEKRIVEYLHKVDVLIVPHHGSKTSSGSEFVDKTKPDIAILSYGKNNYGIPGVEVIERYLETGSKIFSTFEHGEIVIIVDKKGNYEVNYFNMDTKKDYVFIFIVSWLMVIFVLQVLNYKRSNEFYGI